ncbi:MAG: prepilin-type N-terminal cleavage/methylation domain-containing protein [Candidatus Gastranaerophilales bacterium]
MRKIKFRAYTLAEVMITMMIVAVVASVGMGVTKFRYDSITSYTYYSAFNSLRTIAKSLIASSDNESVEVDADGNVQFTTSANKLCDDIEGIVNTNSGDCSGDSINTTTTDFSDVNLEPDLILANGMKYYNLSDSPSAVSKLGAQTAYTVYIDVDGSRGKSELYSDVFPFYITLSGQVIPAYSETSNAGANYNKHLSVSVKYDDYTTSSRTEKWLSDNIGVDYKSAACASGIIEYIDYCDSITKSVSCTYDADCRLFYAVPTKLF